MEESLDSVLAGLLLKQGTTGAMVVDANGLALGLQGAAANERAAGAAAALVERAKKLGEAGSSPSVCIQTDSGSILLEESGGNTLVLYRGQTAAQ